MAGIRLTGISSGIDTDSAVKEMSKSYQLRIDNVKKDKQLVMWRQEIYRGVSDKIKSFTSGYFDTLKGATNFRSSSAFAKFTYGVKVAGVDSTKVSVTANGDVKSFSHKINSISQLASKDTWTGSESGIKGIKTNGFELADFKADLGASDFKMTVSVDGTAKTITISNTDVNNLLDTDALVNRLNTEISSAFGADYTNMVSKVMVGGSDELKFDMKANVVKVLNYTGFETSLSAMDLTNGQSNFDYATKKVSELFDLTGINLSNLKLNGVTVSGLSANDTITTFMDKINGSGANVKLYYNTTQDKFIMESTKEGSANDIALGSADTTNMLSKMGITDGAGRTKGKNALLKLDGVDIIQSSNTFTFEGITYTLKAEHLATAGDIDIDVRKDTTAIFDNIVKFVNEYNSLLDELNTKINEKTYRDFKPLTDEEKEAMTEEQVKAWEIKAKSGLIKGDTEIDGMVRKMRNAIYDTVSNVGISMSEIGITSSTDYKQKGKLIINETKLKAGIENRYDDVVKLFTNESDKDYLSKDDITERYNENGIANRLYDIFQDANRLTRDSSGKKGFLTEKAGAVGDSTQYNNTLQKSINDYDKRIDKLLDVLADQQEKYYNMFARMEAAMKKMESQSSWLSQQLGGK